MVTEPAPKPTSRFKPLLTYTAISSALSAALAMAFLFRLTLSFSSALQIWLQVHAGPLLWLPYPAGFEWYDVTVTLVTSLALIGVHLCRPRRWTKILAGVGLAMWFLMGWTVLIQGY